MLLISFCLLSFSYIHQQPELLHPKIPGKLSITDYYQLWRRILFLLGALTIYAHTHYNNILKTRTILYLLPTRDTRYQNNGIQIYTSMHGVSKNVKLTGHWISDSTATRILINPCIHACIEICTDRELTYIKHCKFLSNTLKGQCSSRSRNFSLFSRVHR